MNGAQMTFFGNLTRDPEMRYGKDNGTPYTTIGIACNRRRGRDEEPETIFFEATLWGNNAQNCTANCHKGDEIFIQGIYSFREYFRRDERPGYSHQVNVQEFRRVSYRRTLQDQEPPEEINPSNELEEENGASEPREAYSNTPQDNPFG